MSRIPERERERGSHMITRYEGTDKIADVARGADLMETLDIAPLIGNNFVASTGFDCKAYKIGNLVTLTAVIHPTVDIPANTTKYNICTLPSGFRPNNYMFGIFSGKGLCTGVAELSTNGVLSVLKYSSGGKSIIWDPTSNLYISMTYVPKKEA